MPITSLSPFFSPLSRWPSIWDDDFSSLTTQNFNNNLDVYETDTEVVVKANVAGVPTDKIDVTYEEGVLWIRAEADKEVGGEDKKHYSKSSWSYSYKVGVPGNTDPNSDPDVMVENGVMTVTFKKAEKAQPKKLTVRTK